MIKLTRKGRKAKAALFRERSRLKDSIRRNLHEVGRELINEARRTLMTRKFGRVYNVVVRGRRVRHRASAPYQAPANMTGNLKNQIRYRVSGNYMFFESNADYSKFLEDGTSKMLPRPFMSRAAKKKMRRSVNILRRLR